MPTAPKKHRPPGYKPRGSSTERGYGTRWGKASKAYRAKHPLCVLCWAKGKTTLAKVVDHVVPHRGDIVAFWDVDNWQSLGGRCYAVKTGGGE